MASIINTNINSITAQRNLSMTQSSLATSMQRLSSGLRINSAKDDAAGLSIAERFTTQIRGLNQASRNANDGISLAQTAEGALAEITSNLQRIRELAVQSGNSTNSSADRNALDQEVQQRLAEIDRVGSQTSFNGQKILDGSFGNATFQVGANVGETISIGLSTSSRANAIGQVASAASTLEVTSTALSGSGTIQVGTDVAKTIGASVAGTGAGQTVGSAYAKAQAINAASVPGLTATATNNVAFAIANVVGTTPATDTYSLTINGEAIFTTQSLATGLSSQEIVNKINVSSTTTGVSAALEGGVMRLSAADGRDINIGQTLTAGTGGIAAGTATPATASRVAFTAGTIDTVANAALVTAGVTGSASSINGGSVKLSATEKIAITGDATALGFSASTAFDILKDTTTISSASVKTVAGANDAITRTDSALSSISSLRSTFGAIQNRFDSVIATLSTTSENLSASRSRVQDADFAQETANLSRAQILQQAGTAMVAQANQLPQGVLALLR